MAHHTIASCLSVLLMLLLGPGNTFATRSPIIIVPGFMGSQLQGTMQNAYCYTPNPVQLWFSFLRFYCIPDLELQFDPATGTFSDKSGVSVSVPGFGDTSTVECLDSNAEACNIFKSELQYFKTFVDFFVSKFYVRKHDIRAAPYDWRYAANSARLSSYFLQLKHFIEETYTMNSNRSVTLVVHSMGGPMSLHFLNQVVTTAWKDQYISAYVTLSGAFAGATRSLGAIVAGVSPIGSFGSGYLRSIERSIQSLYWLSPDPAVFGSLPLVDTPAQMYTASDYQALYDNFLNYPVGFLKYRTTIGINSGYRFPQVPTYCFYGSDVNTSQTYVYTSNDPPMGEQPSVITGPGDGTVNQVSLEVCLNWRNINNGTNPNFQAQAFPGVDHIGMVNNLRVLNLIAQIAITSDTGDLVNSSHGLHVSFMTLVFAISVMAANLVI